MGKSWDKLEGPGHHISEGAGFSHGGSSRFQGASLPSYSGGTPNFLCANCGGSQRGKNRKGFFPCRCDAPAFPQRDVFIKKRHAKMQEWHLQWLKECYRVLRPGGIIKVFSATRTFHRLAAAMEDAGFFLDPEHSIEAWSFGSGFPKYLNTSKAIDAHLGKTHERPVVGTSRGVAVADNQGFGGIARGAVGIKQVGVDLDKTSAATPEAARFDGWATALKPGWEPFLVGMKPHD